MVSHGLVIAPALTGDRIALKTLDTRNHLDLSGYRRSALLCRSFSILNNSRVLGGCPSIALGPKGEELCHTWTVPDYYKIG